jgi:zinc transport system permease protein
MLRYEFMQRAFMAAILVGLSAPTVGVHLVHRRLALIGDGLGHVALTGVAVAILTRATPVTIALISAVIGAVAIEVIRAKGRTSGDVALAILFYGGISAGVVLISQAPGGTPGNLNTYLFGAITTTTPRDVVTFAVLTAAVLAITLGLGRYLFAVGNDEEHARAAGLPVLTYNVLLAVVTATTVVVAMRVVGLLLISALMIVPVATAQLLARSYRTTVALAMAFGVAAAIAGVASSYQLDTPSGGTIVLFAIAAFVLVALGSSLVRFVTPRLRARRTT